MLGRTIDIFPFESFASTIEEKKEAEILLYS